MFTIRVERLIPLLLCVIFGAGSAIGQQAQQQATNDVNKQTRQSTGDPQPPPCDEAEALKRNVQQLSGEVQKLKSKVALLEKDRLATTLQEQLEHEQDRAEKFQLHLIEITEKEAPLLARIDQINQQLKPEAMERTLAGVGSVHPEDLRDETKKAFVNERYRIQMQLDVLRQDRYRTMSSLATTDAAIARIKQKLMEALR
jgi:hypothetical protein